MKGYITIAQNTKTDDYVRQAYALALSIKNTQSTINQFAICVNDADDVPEHYKHVFDHIITIPWGDDASDSRWKIQNKWKYYYMTPFDETVVLDSDMIFTRDYSYWWDYMSQHEMLFTTNVRDFKGQIADGEYYRKTFISNELPSVYTAFMYFKKTRMSAEVFRMTEYIFKHWQEIYLNLLDRTRPKSLSGDVAFALAIKVLGLTEECTSTNTEFPSFTHMKSFMQGVNANTVTDDWTKHFPSYVDAHGNITVGNYHQTYPFHYHQKQWLTDNIIQYLEKQYEQSV